MGCIKTYVKHISVDSVCLCSLSTSVWYCAAWTDVLCELPRFKSTFQVLKISQASTHSEHSALEGALGFWAWQKLVIKHHKVLLSPVPDSHHLCFPGSPRCLDNFTSMSQPRLTLTLFSSVSNPHPILIKGQAAWKELSVCLPPSLFGLHGLASWLHRKQLNKIGRKSKFVSPQFFSGKIPPAPGNVLTQDSQRCWDMFTHVQVFLYCRSWTVVCSSSGILNIQWWTEVDEGTN